MVWNWHFSAHILPGLLSGLLVTVELTLAGSAGAMVLGLVWAMIRRKGLPVLSPLVRLVIEFVRGTPLLVQAYFLFYVFPNYGITLPALATGMITLAINYSAYTAEVYRAGIESVPRGQWEAAGALNLPARRLWQAIVIPQALRAVLPALGNYVIAMFKDSAILSVITVPEVMSHAVSIGSSTFRYLEPFTIAGILYFAVSYPSVRLIRSAERRLAAPGPTV